MIITLKPYQSKDFPVMAAWKISGLHFYGLYENKEQAIAQLCGRFGKVTFRDKLQGGKNSKKESY